LVSKKHTAQKLRSGLPDSLEMVAPTSKASQGLWFSFSNPAVYIPFMIVHKKEKDVPISTKSKLTLKISWTGLNGTQQTFDAHTGADKGIPCDEM